MDRTVDALAHDDGVVRYDGGIVGVDEGIVIPASVRIGQGVKEQVTLPPASRSCSGEVLDRVAYPSTTASSDLMTVFFLPSTATSDEVKTSLSLPPTKRKLISFLLTPRHTVSYYARTPLHCRWKAPCSNPVAVIASCDGAASLTHGRCSHLSPEEILRSRCRYL
eukprot:scaffold6362_cov378-Prasinococcus_capsulatus_cf.AAC.9